MEKSIIWLTTLTALALPFTASAVPLIFDPDGVGGFAAVSVDEFDFGASSVLNDGGVTAIANFANNTNTLNGVDNRDTTFTVLSHARISTLRNNGLAVFSHDIQTAGELTAVFGFTETVTAFDAAAGTVSFGFVDDGNSFLRIFFDSIRDSSDLAGTGFDNGIEVFSSEVAFTNGGSFTANQANIVDFDQTVGDLDFVDNDFPGVQTIVGSGANETIQIVVSLADATYNEDFFNPDQIPLEQFFITNLDFSVPFTTVDPSRLFSDGNGGIITPDLGAVNGQLLVDPVTGEFIAVNDDFQFTTDATTNIDAIPEPTNLALLGIGLLAFGISTRKKAA